MFASQRKNPDIYHKNKTLVSDQISLKYKLDTD